MQSSEMREAGRLAGEAIGGVASYIGEVHEAIAARPFEALGVAALPVRAIHDRVADAAYRGVRAALAAGPRAGARLLARSTPAGAPALSASPRGSFALGALNGAIGDLLAGSGSELALRMTVRRRGQDVELTREGVAAAFPDATSKLAVFVHGLGETEDAWHLAPLGTGSATRLTYGSRLKSELGYTPVYVRYNTGLHVSDNGRGLSALLDGLVDSWAQPVTEIALIGHSMGGLVSRSACHIGNEANARWVSRLRHVFCLGTPHLGAPLEKAANVAGWALARLPETRPLAKLVNGRSAGIKDLRFGSCAEADWCDCDPDEFLKDRCQDVPFLETATYYFVGATLSERLDDPLGSLVGDLLVRYPSASGRGRRRRIPFEIENGLHLGGLNHFHLLNHPAVYEQLRKWLARPALTAAPAAL